MNDIERAIEILKEELTISIMGLTVGQINNQQKSLDLAISALEKQLNCGWITFEIEYDEDFKMDMLQGNLPDNEEEIFVTDGKSVWSDTFMRDGMECYLDSGYDLVSTVIAWQPLPEPYKEVEKI